MQHDNINQDEFRIALARRKLNRVELAIQLDYKYSTMSGWLVGRHPAPDDFRRKVEAALGLPPGTLEPHTRPTGAT